MKIGKSKKIKVKLQIDKESWAPGIWAGTEGMRITINPNSYTVEKVDLIKRVITVKASPVEISYAKVIK